MKKLWFILSTIVAISFVGCNSDSEGLSDPYAAVRPGITIYNCAEHQMLVSGDAASTAVKLAMLMDEAAAKDVPMMNVTVTYNNGDYLLKNLLFGAKTEIKDLGNGDYEVVYDRASLAVIDNMYRHGSYLIHTGGKSLAQSSESEAWSVEVASEKMLLIVQENFNTLEFMVVDGLTTLYRLDGETGGYVYELEGVKAYFAGYENMKSNWSGSFVWAPSTVSSELSYSTHKEDSYTMYGSASGVSIYTFDNLVNASMKYYVPVTAPIKWQPSKTSSYTVITDGDVTASLLSPLEYSPVYYPSPSVLVSRSTVEKTIYTTVTYNGVTLKL